MSGIEEERIKNIEIIELTKDLLKCNICSKISDYPQYCSNCEISFCKNCLCNDKLKYNKAECRICNNPNLENFPKLFKTFYENLEIKCKNITCGNFFKYFELSVHENKCLDNLNKISTIKQKDLSFINQGLEHNENYKEEELNFDSYVNISENYDLIKSFDKNNIENLINENRNNLIINKEKEENLNDMNENSFSFVTNQEFSYVLYDNNENDKILNLDQNNGKI